LFRVLLAIAHIVFASGLVMGGAVLILQFLTAKTTIHTMGFALLFIRN